MTGRARAGGREPHGGRMKRMGTTCRWLSVLSLFLLTGGAEALILKKTVVGPNGTSVEISKMPHITGRFGPKPKKYDVQGVTLTPASDGCRREDYGIVTLVDPWIALVIRGSCDFIVKAKAAEMAGAVGMIVGNQEGDDELIFMGYSKPHKASDISIPSVLVLHGTFSEINDSMSAPNTTAIVYLNATLDQALVQLPHLVIPGSLRTAGYALMVLPVLWCCIAGSYFARKRCKENIAKRQRENRARNIPLTTFHRMSDVSSSTDNLTVLNDTCAICLEEFTTGGSIKILPCHHGFHGHCIDPWVNQRSELCPVCKREIAIEQTAPTTCAERCAMMC